MGQVQVTKELCNGTYKDVDQCKAAWKKIKGKAFPKSKSLDELVRAADQHVMKRPASDA